MTQKFIGFAVDPVADGSTKEILGSSPSYAAPTLYVPVETAQANAGYTNTDRSNQVKGQRGESAPIPFAALPTMTFKTLLTPTIAAFFIPKLLGGTIAVTGTSPAALTSKIPTSNAKLPALQAIMVRGTQTDRFTGLWFDSAVIEIPADGEITLSGTMRALWHKPSTTASPPTPTYVNEEPYGSVVARALLGAGGTPIDCFSSATITIDNQLIDDREQIYCKGQNIETTLVSGNYRRRIYPGLHKLGNTKVTTSIKFATERPDIEDRVRLATADKLAFEAAGNPINPATTPPADELFRITLPYSAFTEGGASDLVQDRDADSTYTVGGFLDPTTNQPVFAEFVRGAAVS